MTARGGGSRRLSSRSTRAPASSLAPCVEHAVPGIRLVRILFEVLRFALANVARKLHLGRSRTPASEQLCLSPARLGTTFIKFGQALNLARRAAP